MLEQQDHNLQDDSDAAIENSNTEKETDKELEIENGFFTVDDDEASEENKNDEEGIKAKPSMQAGGYENSLTHDMNTDTIDAAFNSALGVTKKDNLTARNSDGIYEEPIEDNTDDEETDELNDDEKDII